MCVCVLTNYAKRNTQLLVLSSVPEKFSRSSGSSNSAGRELQERMLPPFHPLLDSH